MTAYPRLRLDAPSVLETRVVDQVCLLDASVGAVATSAGPPIDPLPAPFPYERLAHTSSASRRLEWVRRHARTPGWRMLVPRAVVTPSLTAEWSGRPTPAGYLLLAREPDPFSLSDATLRELERCLVPYMGSAGEAAAAFRDVTGTTRRRRT